MIDLKQLTVNYFESFNSKDVEGLKNLYSQKVELIDWVGEWSGIEDVLGVNRGLFNEGIQIKVNQIYQSQNRTYNHITISIGEDELKVLDVIQFDENGFITKIEAYKG